MAIGAHRPLLCPPMDVLQPPTSKSALDLLAMLFDENPSMCTRIVGMRSETPNAIMNTWM